MDLHSLSTLDVSAVSDAESPISRVVLHVGGQGRDSGVGTRGAGGATGPPNNATGGACPPPITWPCILYL